MKAYLHPDGHHSRTQAEAKANGQPFETIDVPTDHAGLISYINAVRANSITVSFRDPDDVDLGQIHDEIQISRQASPYRNGDPTSVFLKSRDPSAIFTCTQCGANNRNP